MTDVFLLKRDRRTLIVIDLANFGQASRQRPPPPEAVSEAELLAAKILTALNESGSAPYVEVVAVIGGDE